MTMTVEKIVALRLTVIGYLRLHGYDWDRAYRLVAEKR
jgi:hypothetical protein